MMLIVLPVFGRQTDTDEALQRPANCEGAIIEFESAIHAAGLDGTVRVVAHRGEMDLRDNIVQRRLFNAVTFLTDFYPRLRVRADQVIAAEGDPVQGLGTLELFVGERLVGTILARPNRDVHVGHCDDRDLTDRKFFPWRERAGEPEEAANQ